MADDTELFVGSPSASSATRPNILFIIDNSGSMGTLVRTQATYDPSVTYAGTCSTSLIYWRSGTGDPPSCGTSRYFNASAYVCLAGMKALGTAGFYTDTQAQYDSVNYKKWMTLNQFNKTGLVECKADNGIHGDGDPATDVYPKNGVSNPANAWQATANGAVVWGSSPTDQIYTTYSGNYLNWYYGPTSNETRLKVVQDVATNLLNSMTGVNVGLMTFNYDQGGYVVHAMENVATARSSMITQIDALTASNWTPLSETLYEAGLYYRGKGVYFGTNSVAASRNSGNPNIYDAPIDDSCQKNFIVLLTDGEPTKDHDADTLIKNLQDANGKTFADFVPGGQCDVETYPAGFSPDGGDCLDDLAQFLHDGDQSSLGGTQNINTYTVGFTVDLPILADTASRGGGQYYTANDTASLSTALSNIVTSILDTQTTFLSPTVSINSFNRTQNLNDLFISVFKPSAATHWPGNLKKYRLDPTTDKIVDAKGAPAVDPATGFFADTSQSFWSANVDGSDIQSGGAANQIPAPATRKVFTYIAGAGADLTVPGNRISTTNTQLTDALLNIGNPGDPSHTDLVNFINGLDVTDVNQNNNTTEARNQMGDPLHSQPVTVIYGPTVDDATVYFATNDGYLHAINTKTGVERWAFIPPDFLKNQRDLFINASRPTKEYGIDGSLRVQVLANADGVIGPGEKVYLFFGMRRGGDMYYGLDVTNPDAPKFMWKLDSTNLPGVGQSWATPVPSRINIQGATQNTEKFVLVIGGGYEPDQDNVMGSTDVVGNSIYIVDSVSGNLLWRGSKSGGTENFAVSNKSMDYSIPAEVKVIDFDGDGFADRMYAADMGGQVWRFDVLNGQPASTLINGGVFAQLGMAPSATPLVEDTRRFYYSPDIALVNTKDYHFVHVGIGSGHRAHPLSLANQDRFYALRDNAGLAGMTQAAYDAFTPIRDTDLVDVTTNINAVVPQGSPGWKLLLDNGGWQGEKVLAESRTFNNQVFFTTFTPSSSGTSCEPKLGTNKLYVMSLFNGAPVTNLDGSQDTTTLTETDRYRDFTGSISSEVTFIFPSPGDPNCVGDQCTPPPVACVDLFCFPPGFGNAPVRTFWSQTRVDN